MATNRADTLDPALLRPGRLDRKIEFPLPSRREKRLIFQTVTSKMNLGPDVDLEDCEAFTEPLLLCKLADLSEQTSRVRTGYLRQKLPPLYKLPVFKVPNVILSSCPCDTDKLSSRAQEPLRRSAS